MKTILFVTLIIGILIGYIVGYGYFVATQKSESWHQVTTFIVSTSSPALEVFKVAYSYSNIYYGIVNFTISTNFWRVIIETIPYFNYSERYIVYYSDYPLNVIHLWKDKPYFMPPFAAIALLCPAEYNVTTWVYGEVRGFGFYYAYFGVKYTPVKTVYTFAGKGNYSITLAGMGIGCFKFTIEEYS